MSQHVPTPIEDYAVLGDLGTAALVSRRGSVDWLCLPRFDSRACFAALLGTPDHGRWLITPADPDAVTTRRYVGNSFVLETTHETATGRVRVTDLMPLGDGRSDLLRRVEGLEGTVRMVHEWTVRFDYGRTRPWVTRHTDDREDRTDEIITAIAGPDMLVLRGARLPHAQDGHHVDEFDVAAGQTFTFSTTWFRSHEPIPPPLRVRARIDETIALSEVYAARSDYVGPVRRGRDALAARAARPDPPDDRRHRRRRRRRRLPEDFGGERNWDYRFCWLRDAALTLEALLGCGYVEETELWRDWLLRAVAGDPEDMQIMYRVDGGRDLPERVLEHLPGYAGSRPVRVGNAAVDQRQTDVLGEVMIALDHARSTRARGDRRLLAPAARPRQPPRRALGGGRQRPLGDPRPAAALHPLARHGVGRLRPRRSAPSSSTASTGPVEHWRELRDQVRDEVLTKGFDAERNTFVQHYDTTEVDASLLTLSSIGFVDGDDPRMLGTIAAVEPDLMRDGLVMRYRTDTGVDGLAGDEHPFLACSFWLVTAYAQGGYDDARPPS